MNKNYKKEYLKNKLKAAKEGRNELSLEELDKLMIRDLKRAYNEGIKMCIKSIQLNLDYCRYQNGIDSCKNCGLSEEQFKKLLLK